MMKEERGRVGQRVVMTERWSGSGQGMGGKLVYWGDISMFVSRHVQSFVLCCFFVFKKQRLRFFPPLSHSS
jgi:hypothetical protein